MDLDLERVTGLLERTPHVLRAWFSGLRASHLERTEGVGTWSPHDVLAHLLHGEEEDWIPRTRLILEHGASRAFEPFDPEGFRGRYDALDPPARLTRFEVLRARNLAELRELHLAQSDLVREGLHPVLGPVTLGNLLATWAAHDQTHLAQIARVLAGGAGDVGPWVRLLPLLSSRTARRGTK